MTYTPAPGSPEEIARFQALQRDLQGHFRRFAADPTLPYTAVVVPSNSFDPVELAKISGVAHYEERFLFNLMLLRHPRLHVIFLSSKRINPLVVDYYLHHLRGVPSAHARRRLTLLDCDDASPRPLTEKLLERPLLLRRVQAMIPDPTAAHVVVFNSTPLERTLSVQLGVPLNACDPDLVHWGSKTGSRRLFKEAGLPLAAGREGLRDVDELVDGLGELWEEVPDLKRAVVKVNEGFSGEGNAVLDLRPLAHAAPGEASPARRREVLREALPGIRCEAEGCTWEGFAPQLEKLGGVCEQWIEGEGKRSPSVQMRINPVREVQPISTHDQVLGGPNGQVFLGGLFPADSAYRLQIQEMGCRLGHVMAQKGVIGRFGVDFLSVPNPRGGWDSYAVEINLRAGGTTHPFNTMKFITDGRYDAETGRFFTAQGRERVYFSTDVLAKPEYRGLLPFDLMDLLVVNGVHFRADETGVVFHLMGCLSEYGKLGCTCVAEDLDEARALYERVVGLIDGLVGRG